MCLYLFQVASMMSKEAGQESQWPNRNVIPPYHHRWLFFTKNECTKANASSRSFPFGNQTRIELVSVSHLKIT